ncbi:MAG: nucleotidyltransferase domain-containing protein [Thermoplasmata archaeon]
MTRRLYRTAQCYRCGYVWRLRRRVPRICARCKSPKYALPKLHIATYGSGLGIEEIIGEKRREVLRLVRKFGGRGARVFGSVARREAGQASDVDMLVGPVRPNSLRLLDLQMALEDLLGRKVDLVAEDALFWLVQPQVLAEAVPL